MKTARAELGRAAEDAVASKLVSEGYVILARNARVGHLELDIVARKGPLLVVCEVRARRSTAIAHPAETFDHAKRARTRAATAKWLHVNRPGTTAVRLDAAAVVATTGGLQIEYYEGVL